MSIPLMLYYRSNGKHYLFLKDYKNISFCIAQAISQSLPGYHMKYTVITLFKKLVRIVNITGYNETLCTHRIDWSYLFFLKHGKGIRIGRTYKSSRIHYIDIHNSKALY